LDRCNLAGDAYQQLSEIIEWWLSLPTKTVIQNLLRLEAFLNMAPQPESRVTS
jgi:hypothetical protein